LLPHFDGIARRVLFSEPLLCGFRYSWMSQHPLVGCGWSIEDFPGLPPNNDLFLPLSSWVEVVSKD